MSASGSQNFTGAGTFTVPEYTTLTVTAHGAKGADATAVAACGGGSYTGGTGGKAVKTWKPSDSGAPVIGASISITTSGQFRFASSTAVIGNNGTSASPGASDGGADPVCISSPGNGSNGTGSGGDTNTTGGSGFTAGRIEISWT